MAAGIEVWERTTSDYLAGRFSADNHWPFWLITEALDAMPSQRTETQSYQKHSILSGDQDWANHSTLKDF
jgi:hypothetical protein